MKNQPILLVLALILGIGIGWVVKPDSGSAAKATGAEDNIPVRPVAKPQQSASAKSGDEAEVPRRKTETRSIVIGGDEELTPKEQAMQDQISKAMEDRQAKSDEKTIASLVEKLGLDAAQEGALKEYYAKRRAELGKLFSDATGESPDMSQFSENKLDDLMAEVLTFEQKAAYDEVKTAEREKKVESRALKDLAKLNSVIDLRPEQKDAVYQVLYDDAGAKVDKAAELGTSVFGSLFGNGFGVEMDMESIAMHDSLYVEGAEGAGEEMNLDAFRDAQQKRVDDQVNRLSSVLDENQLKNYRDHLESQGSVFESFVSPAVEE